GTAVRHALGLIQAAGGTPAGIAIALDRQEVVDEAATPRRSAAQAVADAHAIPVIAVAGLDDLLAFTGETAKLSREQAQLRHYRARYGAG
ncbi:MAG: orotate phosphoribosyltransferase, partial [Luteimonas sp.]